MLVYIQEKGERERDRDRPETVERGLRREDRGGGIAKTDIHCIALQSPFQTIDSTVDIDDVDHRNES